MPFTESVKREAREKAHFRCVMCRDRMIVEVHHIIPEAEGGPNTLDNAAPLCGHCHNVYGNNPDLRRQIREARDQWYEICEEHFKNPDVTFFVEKLGEMEEKIRDIKVSQKEDSQTLIGIQTSLSELLSRASGSIMNAKSIEDISATSGYITAATSSTGEFLGSTICPYCGTNNFSERDFCARCGKPLFGL